MIHLIVFVVALLGFAVLHLAMPRHQQDWLGRKLAPALGRRLRLAGFAVLILAFGAAGCGFGWAVGTLVWCGWLTAAAALVVTANLNSERILARIRR